jgi:hypothetical protein
VRLLEERFDEVLGPHARRLGYFSLLDDDSALKQLIATAPVPSFERHLAGATRPLVKPMLRRGLRIPPASARRSRARVEEIFTEVEQRLADGRPSSVARASRPPTSPSPRWRHPWSCRRPMDGA